MNAEKDALSVAKDDWVIGLHYTFQDDQYLYMVMEPPGLLIDLTWIYMDLTKKIRK